MRRQPLPHPLLSLRKNSGLPLLFLLLIFLPLADMTFKIVRDVPVNEKRKMAAKPQFQPLRPWDFAKKYEAYFNDHFGFRSQLLHFHNLLTVRCFHASPIDRVVVGGRGWLFIARENKTRSEMDYFRALRPFTPEELLHWRQILGQRRAWLASRGIVYIFMVVPNKSTIYPEHLPANIRRLHEQSRLDQLLAALRLEGGFPVIDLRQTLLAAKNAHQLYKKTDSHWNELGAYFAYAEIMKKLSDHFPGLKIPALDHFTITRSDRAGGDLAQMLSLQKKYYREQTIQLQPQTPVGVKQVQIRKNIGPNIKVTITESPAADLPAMLMVHDSFAHQLKPFLSPRFRRSVYIWDWGMHFFTKLIEREKPKIVIDETTERFLCDLVLKNPSKLNQPAIPPASR